MPLLGMTGSDGNGFMGWDGFDQRGCGMQALACKCWRWAGDLSLVIDGSVRMPSAHHILYHRKAMTRLGAFDHCGRLVLALWPCCQLARCGACLWATAILI